MMTKTFSFEWLNPRIHKTVETTGVIISNIHDIKETNHVTVNLNPWAIPFILYYGKGVGGGRYNKMFALRLRGNYTKRIFKIISSQRDKKEYRYPIEKLKKDLGIPENKTNGEIKRDILKAAQQRIFEANTDVWFDFEMYAAHKPKGRKPKDDTILFKIHTREPRKESGEQGQMYGVVYRWMKWCFNTSSSKPMDITERLTNEGELERVFSRAEYYDDKIITGDMTREHAVNSLKKMLREDYGIQ